ncbi:amidohydrolase family protein [bacterium]|nr:amidohydrolase family protein [bacterium]
MNGNNLKILIDGIIIDGKGSGPIKDQAIIIEGKKIKDIVKVDSILKNIKPAYTLYDLKGQYIMPGFIDTHTHVQMSVAQTEIQKFRENIPKKTLRAAFHAKNTFEAGFTSIRDLGAEYLIDLDLRDAINEGLLVGPRMFVSGYKIMPTGADFPMYAPEVKIEGQHVMDSPEAIKREVRTLLARGVDVVKVMTSGRTARATSSPDAYALSLEDTKIVVQEAHNQNKKVSAHAHGAKGIKIALQAGCDSLEHGTILDDQDIEIMLKNNVFLVPTLSYGRRIEQLGGKCDLPKYAIEKALRSRENRLKSFSKALKSGVKIALGSDSGMPFVNHGDNAFEAMSMVEAGMTVMQAIQSMTSCAAELIGISDKIGDITPGKLADIVIVDKNPLQDISVLNNKDNIKAVIKEGKIEIDRGLRFKEKA